MPERELDHPDPADFPALDDADSVTEQAAVEAIDAGPEHDTTEEV